MRKYKVLHLTNFLDLSGQQEDTLNTVYNLNQDQFQAGLAANLEGGDQGLDNVLAREASRVPHLSLHDIPHLKRFPAPWFDLLALFALYNVMKVERYDIVHSHATKSGFLGRIAAKLAGVPIIVHSVHGWAFNYPAAPKFIRYLFVLIERFMARLTDKILPLTGTLVDDALKVKIGRPDQYAAIYSGIDLSQFYNIQVDVQQKRAELGLPATGPIIGTLTIMNRHKGVDDIVRAAPKVLEAVPDAHFLLVGDGELMPKVRSLVKQLNLEDKVILPGLRRDVCELLAIMDVFAHMAWYEILPRAILQAFATGTPAVVARTGSIDEIVKDGENGILVPVHDPDALAEALIKLLRQPELRHKMGQAAKESVSSKYTIETMVRSTEAVYHELIQTKINGVKR